MKVSELKGICETMIGMGHGDDELVLDQSRDGTKSYPKAKARPVLVASATQHTEAVYALAVSYES